MSMFQNFNFDKLKKGLDKTRDKIVTRINETFSGKAQVDETTLEELEEILVTSDIGFDTTTLIIEKVRERLLERKGREKDDVVSVIQETLVEILNAPKDDQDTVKQDNFTPRPYIILVVGVNGAGKTTTVGKLAHNFKKAGMSVLIGSADTFRAAANEQLDVWAERAGVEIMKKQAGSDPSSVVFETLTIAKKKNIDVVLIDTAGRLHTKNNLMEELAKIKRVMKKVFDYAPNDTYLVLDANTGQNALIQATEFQKYTDLSGLILTKLDGTAKGGVVIQLCIDKKLPIKYIGVGEGIEDLQDFDSLKFVTALFDN